MRTTTARRAGLSLVELLVVIGIIGILISILLPVLSKFRFAARRQYCASNLRQVGAILHMYAADNGSELPAAYWGKDHRVTSWFSRSTTVDSDIGLLVGPPLGISARAYVSNAKLFVCPGQPIGQYQLLAADDFLWVAQGSPRTPVSQGGRWLGSMSYSYAYVPKGGDGYFTGPYINGTAKTEWQKGALAGFERHSVAQTKGASTAVMIEMSLPSDKQGRSKEDHHDSGGHVLYLDGHVTWITSAQYARYNEESEAQVPGMRRLFTGVDRLGE
jgi:prepilin-type N-terminal cleavage/methylation domain-containing protein/prepilin-type processing-associated H-X9-DG protein